MDMFNLLSKFSELEKPTLTESSKKGVTTHKGTYGTSHKSGDESHKGDDGEKKSSDTSHLQSFLGSKPADHDSKKGRVHKTSDEAPKGHEYDDGDEAPKKRGRPKKNLKDWIEALDEMIAEDADQFKMVNNPDGSREIIDMNTGLSREYPKTVANQANTDLNKMKLQATAQQPQGTTNSSQQTQQGQQSQGQQPMKEEEMSEKWDKETKVSPSEKGKYDGNTKAELLKMYHALKKSGPHEKGSKEYGKMRELQFAIRAKGDWGKVKEEQTDEMFSYPTKAPRPNHSTGTDELQRRQGLGTNTLAPVKKGGQGFGDEYKQKDQYGKDGKGYDIAGPKGRLPESLEGVAEGKKAKPDFLDIDRDKNTKEPMKDAAKSAKAKKHVKEADVVLGSQPSPLTMANQGMAEDMSRAAKGHEKYGKAGMQALAKAGRTGTSEKTLDAIRDKHDRYADDKPKDKKMKIKEGTDPHESARSEGRAHAMGGHAYNCRHGKGTMEAQCYHEGYVHALEECYGGMNEEVSEEALVPPTKDMFRGKPDVKVVEPFKKPVPAQSSRDMARQMPGQGLPMRGAQFDSPLQRGMDKVRGMFKEDDLEESPFSWAAKNTPEGDKFTVGGKTFTKKADESMGEGWNEGYEMEEMMNDPVLENWDKQLNALLIEGSDQSAKKSLTEGVTVTTSTGQQGVPDSVSISASGEDAAALMALLNNSGISSTGAMPKQGHLSPMTHVRGDGEEPNMAAISIRAMPNGMGMSQQSDYEEEVNVKEPYEYDQIIGALDDGGAEPCDDAATAMGSLRSKLLSLEEAKSPHEDPIHGHEKTEIMRMPLGKMLSHNVKDKTAPTPEAVDPDQVDDALAKDAKKAQAKAPTDKKKSIYKEDADLISEEKQDASDPVVDPHKKTPIMRMPLGKGVSQEPTEDPTDIVEPTNQKEVVSALSTDAKKEIDADKEFKALKSLLDKQNMMDGAKKAVKESEEVDASVDAGNLVLSMPLGKGVSQEPTEEEREAPEAFEQDQVIDALSKDAKKELQADRDFAALKKLIGAHIKVDEKGDKPETPSTKSSGPAPYENAVDKVETKAPSKSDNADSEKNGLV
jgi:hypothetical protein